MKFEIIEQEKQERQKKILITAGIIAATALIIFLIWIAVERITTGNVDTTDGVQAIKELEKTDVKEVEAKVEALEEQTRQEEEAYKNRTPKQKFANSIVMGDSITQGLSEFGILNTSMVIADRGIELEEVSDELKKAEDLNPKNIFLTYGMNDIKATYGKADVFKEQYKKALDELKAKLPDTTFYINSILPVQQKVIDSSKYYANLPQFNKALEELCKEEKITFIDNTDLVKESFYTKDGIHMNPSYYPLWAEHMAEVAEL